MKRKIIEAIPNISEGINEEIIEKLADAIRNTPNCTLMNYSSDKDHNRSVFTYMGDIESVKNASLKLIKRAVELIDMRNHKGEHPRLGAVDVMPFVPIREATMEDCILLANDIGKTVSAELNIPVFLYEEAAKIPERKRLENIRRGQYEGLEEKLKDEKWKPDFGKPIKNEKSGAIVIGARKPLIAFNVLLNTKNIEIAREISKKIRESNGGMKSIKAIGIFLKEKNLAQISMNLTDYTITGLYDVVEKIKKEAESFNVSIISSELIGMLPMKSIIEAGVNYLNIENFDYNSQIIENFLL